MRIEVLSKTECFFEEKLSADYWINVIESYIKKGYLFTKTSHQIMGGFREDFKINDFEYVYRTTSYYGSDYIMYQDKKYFLTSSCELKIMEYLESFTSSKKRL